MATAFQTIDIGLSSKKKSVPKVDVSPVIPPLGLFPKIGTAGNTPVAQDCKNPLSAHGHGADSTHLPKLKTKGDGLESIPSSAHTARRKFSNADEHHPSTMTLPSVSPRLQDHGESLTARMLSGIGGGNHAVEELLASQSTRREKKLKSTKKKKHAKKEKREEGAPHDTAATQANANATATDAADDEYEYDDDEYDESSPSAPASAAHSRAGSLSVDSSASSTAAPSTDISPTLATRPLPTAFIADQTTRRKVGPSVQQAAVDDAQVNEIGEELEASFQVPHTRTRLMPMSPTEVEEESSAQLHNTLSPQALRRAMDLDTSIADDVGFQSDHTDDESIVSLLRSSPAHTTRQNPTSIHPVAKSPAAAAKGQGQAKATKKKQATPAAKATTAKGSTPAPAGGKKVSTPAPHKTASTKSSAPPQPSPISEDSYNNDADWRTQTTMLSSSALQQQLDDAAPDDEASDLPAEMIRFTLRSETIQQLYAGQNTNGSHSNTTLEFSRSQRIPSTSSDASEQQQWVPVFSTDLHSSHAADAADRVAARDDSIITIDRDTFGADPNESLLVRLWNTVYNDTASNSTAAALLDADDNDDAAAPNFNRTLLAEFETSVNEFARQSKADLHDGLDRTQPLTHSPVIGAVAPRSALKAPLESGGGARPPSQRRVRFFDHVEIFRLSDRLDRTRTAPIDIDVTIDATEEKQNGAALDNAGTAAHDLASLIVSEQVFHRRGRMSAGTHRPSGAAPKKSSASKKKEATTTPPTKNDVAATATTVVPALASFTTTPAPPSFVRIRASGSSLAKMSFHGSANPVLEVLIFFSGVWQKPLYRSECQFGTLEPQFKPFVLCAPQSDALLDAPLLIKVVHFDDQAQQQQDTIGQCFCTLRSLLPTGDAAVAPPQAFVLTNPARQKLTSKRTHCGKLTLHFLPPSTPSTASSRRGSAGATHSQPTTVVGTPATAAASARRKSNGGAVVVASGAASRPSSQSLG